MECGLDGETRIVEKFKLTPTCRGIELLGLKNQQIPYVPRASNYRELMTVRIEKSESVWTVILSRPEARNAMNPKSADATGSFS